MQCCGWRLGVCYVLGALSLGRVLVWVSQGAGLVLVGSV